MVAVIWLHEEVAPLTEALNSYWLVIHVVSAIIATGAFTLGGMVSAMYLVKMRKGDADHRAARPGPVTRVAWTGCPTGSTRSAFPVWTFAVLITGPIWAHEAWSSYWNWDPKEVWAFITWVVYAGYLHARATAGWKGRNAAMLALLGLATLWFNFIGINYFSSSSQHSYAAPAPVVEVPALNSVRDPRGSAACGRGRGGSPRRRRAPPSWRGGWRCGSVGLSGIRPRCWMTRTAR